MHNAIYFRREIYNQKGFYQEIVRVLISWRAFVGPRNLNNNINLSALGNSYEFS